MRVRCKVCGRQWELSKWQEAYERLREHPDDPFICEGCQERIRKDALSHQQFLK